MTSGFSWIFRKHDRKWETVFCEGILLGELLRTPHFEIFFGGANGAHSLLTKVFPNYQWARAKQIHGNKILHAETPTPSWAAPELEADGVVTRKQNLAAAILTADCLPVMAWDSKHHIAIAIHAGWKGVANRILPTGLQELIRNGTKPEDLLWWIGPHIQSQSFEVGQEVADQLTMSTATGKKSLRPHDVPQKSKINLSFLAEQQIREFGNPKSIWVSPDDTLTDLRFASFRRNAQAAGRQISFIVSTS